MKFLKYIFITLLAFNVFNAKSQYYSTGSDPANIKWQQVNSPFFKVVFPDDFSHEAKRFIAILDSLYLYGGHTLDHTPKPIKVLVHSRTAYSNGLVSWAPKRIEIYPTANQSVFSQDYLEQLAIHEFRHVVQIDKLNRGFTKVLSIPFGQQAIGAVLGLYVPMWFLEGDATLTETSLSKSGRGRVPSFEQETRAQLLEKERYSYEKAYFGSYKNFVPNHYRMGYLFTAGARQKYGSDVWERALEETGRKSWSITPFNRGIKKVTGKNKVPLYHEVFQDWEDQWQEREQNLTISKVNYLNMRDERYKNYQYPVVSEDSSIIAEINGPGEVRHFIKLDPHSKEETKLLTIGRKAQEPFSYSNGLLCWTELEQHPRWENQHFSVIRTYDLTSKTQQKITQNSRYFAPSLSPSAERLAVVHITNDNLRSIHILSTKDGSLLTTIASPNNDHILTPSWSANGQHLIMVRLTPKGKKLSQLNISTKEWTDLTSPEFTEIVAPKYIGDWVYFSGSWNGIDNIYRIKSDGTDLQKVSESRFGATQVAQGIDSKHILYQDYTSDGYQVAMANLDSLNIQVYSPEVFPNEALINQLQDDELGLPNLKNLPTEDYTVKKYSKWNLFNFHSWAPAFLNIDDATISPGAFVTSQNLLSSTFTTIGYNADSQLSREKYYFKISHRAWWPVIDFEVKAGDEKYKLEGLVINEPDSFYIQINDKETHLHLKTEINLPLNLTRGKWQRRIQPSIAASYQLTGSIEYLHTPIKDKQLVINEQTTRTTKKSEIRSIDYGLFLYNLHTASQRDISSRWGQVVELSYRHTPFGGMNFGSIIGLHTRIYFPGIGRHHALKIDNDWHRKNYGEKYSNNDTYNFHYSFSDFVKFPRGISQRSNTELYSLKADYTMPMMNPDLNIPGFIYLKRITMNLFYDYSYAMLERQLVDNGQWTKSTSNYQSMGTELRAALHPFRFIFPITVGYRYAYIPENKDNYHEFLLSIGLSGVALGNR
ncbi:TolB family protein [Carboxylicivirga sp. N1Y90]|uniref:TolB family protein n=1 Tax=Carboxylicivirga fragile TaxID=3417571 RepID=UPI003D33DE59|nr:hypothetical protein [Marinilabiliaceae bacterium N1Y90]